MTLETLAEPVSDKAFIDILTRLEKLGILGSAFSWVQLRKIGNDIALEYPASLIEGINFLFNNLENLKQLIERGQSILDKHK